MTLAFLDHLGLDEGTDERGIKRAYARLLKQIDQEADPAGFQALREAYETALSWHQARDVHQEAEARKAAQEQSAQPAEPMSSPPHAEAFEVFLGFMGSLPSHGSDKASMAAALALSMDDPRLQSLDERDMFEWFIARALAEGWKPGHEVLLVVAVERFDWGQDRRRLLRFGRVGQMLDSAIAERMVFDEQPLPVNARLKEVIRLLRRPPRPEDPARAQEQQQELEWLVQHLPNWLWIIVPGERVQQWRQWASEGGGHAGAQADAPPDSAIARPATPHVLQRPAQPVAKKTAWPSPLMLFLGLMMVLGTLSNALKGHHVREAASVSSSFPSNGQALAQGTQAAAVGTPSLLSTSILAPTGTQPQLSLFAASAPAPMSPKAMGALVRAGPTRDNCREAAVIAQQHAGAAFMGDPPFDARFDALLAACLQKNRWPSRGDSVLIAALEREASRAKAAYQRTAASVPPIEAAAAVPAHRTGPSALDKDLDMARDLLSVDIKPKARPDSIGPGLSKPASTALNLPKVEMPAADYRLAPERPACCSIGASAPLP